ncbi:MAG TPA: (Fe-S)-binding protein [Actinobacteria bacterium]|nr:(Fe-S)-binding protein [Actinomycetota bacterium]
MKDLNKNLNPSDHFIISFENEVLTKCIGCAKCLKECEIIKFSKFANADLRELQKKRLDFLISGTLSNDVYESAYLCMHCHSCEISCPVDLNTSAINELIKARLKERGKAAPFALKLSVPTDKLNAFGILSKVMFNKNEMIWLNEVPDVDVAVFLGCLYPIVADKVLASFDILDELGVKFAALSGGANYCCGALDSMSGNAKEARERAINLAMALDKLSPRGTILWCSTCYQRLTEISKEENLPFKCQHIIPFLRDNLERINFKKTIDKKITIHDPCHLGRGAGKYDSIRELLGAIPGVEIVEMKHTKEKALCCGGAALFSKPRVAKNMTKQRMVEAQNTGADILASMCAGCHMAFCETEDKYSFEVQNVIGVLAEAMGIEYEDRLKNHSGILKRAMGMLRTFCR